MLPVAESTTGAVDEVTRLLASAVRSYNRRDHALLVGSSFSDEAQALCGGPATFVEILDAAHDEIGPATIRFDRLVDFDGTEARFRATVTEPSGDTSATTYRVPLTNQSGSWYLGSAWPPPVVDRCGGHVAVLIERSSFGADDMIWPFTTASAWFSCREEHGTVHPFVDIDDQRWSLDPDRPPPSGIEPLPADSALWADAPDGGRLPLDDAARLARDVCV